ncbi:DeoR/GlpR family DNA-binding transcription regulator [Bailinhaonella thermotolerans]|uniref:DeoR/GlpR transcriptional regulator n=1 Tax=Bailinhaonella thermotolerans TaxID=1070861 RepID=A0A3A4B2F8_9ACTN|nr:DeoR/GlpR family DNA-binding transcription regulator [Bailinhaonella thermotolerans]RJL34358.1 DeoR/GlpR transcriptional regulator [Bailinhaonella thermotolerans]
MGPRERWNALLDLLAQRGNVEVDEAAAELGVSAATIRRDLDQLARQQMLTRTRGGAVAGAVSYDLPLRYKAARHAPEKERIGRAAAALVGPGSIVGINGGTTTSEVARALALRADVREAGEEPAFTVVTNAVNIANELVVRRRVKIVVTGGVARPASYELIGPLATKLLEEIALDDAVIGVNGFDLEHGATAHDEGEASINHVMAARARRVIVVADSSKLGRRAFCRICPASAVDVLITDDAAPKELTDAIAETGVEVVRV